MDPNVDSKQMKDAKSMTCRTKKPLVHRLGRDSLVSVINYAIGRRTLPLPPLAYWVHVSKYFLQYLHLCQNSSYEIARAF